MAFRHVIELSVHAKINQSMHTIMKKYNYTLFLLASSILFAICGTSCRTVQGFGRDVEHTGDHITEAASH